MTTINGDRPAIESDARNGLAVFYVAEGRSKVFDMGVALPAQGILLEDAGEEQPIPAGTSVQVIQAEILDDRSVLLGFSVNGKQGVCTLEQIAIEPTKRGNPPRTVDVRTLAFEVLDEAKRSLQRDKHLLPLAFLITIRYPIRMRLSFQGTQEKDASYARVVTLAKAHKALAILTVNDAHVSDPNDDDEGYYYGKLAATKSAEAIWITVSGPAITSWSITSPYTRTGEEITFGADVESVGGQLNLLAGWASDHIVPTS
jgi:hypothetical protein